MTNDFDDNTIQGMKTIREKLSGPSQLQEGIIETNIRVVIGEIRTFKLQMAIITTKVSKEIRRINIRFAMRME